MPHGYFDTDAVQLLEDFQRAALAQPHPEQLAFFPETVVETLQNTWKSSATCIYRNWLQYVLTKKAEASPYAAVTNADTQLQRKRSAVL